MATILGTSRQKFSSVCELSPQVRQRVNHHPTFAVYYWTALHQVVLSHPLPSMTAHSVQSWKPDVFVPVLRESTLKVLHL